MFIALISTIISSFSDVFWQKSLSYKVGYLAQSLASFPVGLVLSGFFIAQGFSFSDISIVGVGAVFCILFLDIVRDPLVQKIYREEKISVLMPYFNLNKIFIIISSFFLFQDVSSISLFITIFTAGLIMIAAFDIKSKRLPRNFGKIIFTESVRAIGVLTGGWMILNYGEVSYFILYVLIGGLAYLLLSFYTGQYRDLGQVPAMYWKFRFIGGLGWVSWFLSLVVIKNLGLSISVLLGFLGVGITLLISYIFSKDIPSKKNIAVTVTVALLIGAGYYFK